MLQLSPPLFFLPAGPRSTVLRLTRAQGVLPQEVPSLSCRMSLSLGTLLQDIQGLSESGLCTHSGSQGEGQAHPGGLKEAGNLPAGRLETPHLRFGVCWRAGVRPSTVREGGVTSQVSVPRATGRLQHRGSRSLASLGPQRAFRKKAGPALSLSLASAL